MDSRIKQSFARVKQDIMELKERDLEVSRRVDNLLDKFQEVMSEKIELELKQLKLDFLKGLEEITEHFNTKISEIKSTQKTSTTTAAKKTTKKKTTSM